MIYSVNLEKSQFHVVLYTVPQATCDSKKMSWYDVAALVKNQMMSTFGEMVSFEHIEFMSQGWFDRAKPQELLGKGEVNFPFVMVNDELACADKKVNLSKIKQLIQANFNHDTIYLLLWERWCG